MNLFHGLLGNVTKPDPYVLWLPIPPPDYLFYFSISKIVIDRIYGHILDNPQKKIMYPRKK